MTRPFWLIAAPFVFLLLWSAGFPVAKLGLQHAEPLTLLALRYVIVLAVLIPVAIVMSPPLPKTWRAAGDVAELTEEAADLIYHLLVLLRSRDLAFARVLDVLRDRANRAGIKAARVSET